MMAIGKELETIKESLLSLKAAGSDGFEGLLRIALTHLTGIPFRLAASGLQGGIDGNTAMQTDPVCFEAKRYSGDIHRNEVITKIADLSRKNNSADRLWILGATTEISAQLAEAIKEDGDKSAISTLILDWTEAPLPLLAVALVAAGEESINFIVKHYNETTGKKKVGEHELKSAFSSISGHSDFEKLLERLKQNLNVPNLSFQRAVQRNEEWHKETFSYKQYAKERLGQALTVLNNGSAPSMRSALRKQIANELAAGNGVVLLGDEGHGKSWIAAQLCSSAAGLAVFISAEQFDGIRPHDLDNFFISLLIKQTGEINDDATKKRWEHRLKAWKAEPPLAPILFVVDGINQRQSFQWHQLLDGIQSRLSAIRGQMLVTARPQFWHKAVAPGINFKPKIIQIPQWTFQECNELLKHHGISLDWLDEQTLETLKNPRLLAISIETLPHSEAVAWKGLTTDRLLMEHLRASQRENYEEESFKALTARLGKYASDLLEKVQALPDELPKNFQKDSKAVIETRFFRSLDGPGDLYELRDEGLTLALGFAVVDQLWKEDLTPNFLAERTAQLIEPIKALDRTADVLFASLLICALDNIRFNISIFSTLLNEFANLQNIDDQRFEEFCEIVKTQPQALLDTVKMFCLEKGRRLNADWFVYAAHMISSTDDGWLVAAPAIHQWLRCYNKDPVEQASRLYVKSNLGHEEKIAETAAYINEEIKNLSPFEVHLQGQMTDVEGDLDELIALGLKMLANRSLGEFADAFVAMGLAFALDKSIHTSTQAFRQLTIFNRMDRKKTREAFLNAISPLRTGSSSKGGQWTVVRMLYATGNAEDAAQAITLAEELRKDWHLPDPLPANEWRQVKVADPAATAPTDMEQGLEAFTSLDVNQMRQHMGWSMEDQRFDQFLPVAIRFELKSAVEKTRSLLAGFLTRTGLSLRQLIANSEEYLPLIDTALAEKFVQRIGLDDPFAEFQENEQWFFRGLSLYYVLGQLSPDAQLSSMTGKISEAHYLLSMRPSIKSQRTDVIVKAVRDALERKDEHAAHGALVAAFYGGTPVNDELEDLILQFLRTKIPILRPIAFKLAMHNKLNTVRQEHVASDWNASSVDEQTNVSWFGSMLLIEACAGGEIVPEALLRRISHETWFAAAEKLGPTFAKPMAACFVQKLREWVQDSQKALAPLVDFKFSIEEFSPYPYRSLENTDRGGERFPKYFSQERITITRENLEKNEKNLNLSAKSFLEELKNTGARLLMQNFTISELEYLSTQVPSLLDDLLDILNQSNKSEMVWLKNLSFAVANLISYDRPEQAVDLFECASSSKGFVTLALGDDLTLEHQAIWGAKSSKPIEALWLQRLTNSENDAVLAREVLAAERFGASAFIKETTLGMASQEDTLDQAYALSIAGYSGQPDLFSSICDLHAGSKGIVGSAASHAQTEYKNAQWAHAWVSDMWKAETPEKFWRCMIIAKSVMDARVSQATPKNSRWALYGPAFSSARKFAIKERNKQREKTLIGQSAPDKIFISPKTEIQRH